MKYPINLVLIGLVLSCFNINLANADNEAVESLLSEGLPINAIEWVSITIKGNTWPEIKGPTLNLGDDFSFFPALHSLPSDFSMMKTEVTCTQMLAGEGLSSFRKVEIANLCEYGMDEPVTGVAFHEANDFCNALDASLPTESQWVYAASQVTNDWLTRYGMINYLHSEEPQNELLSYFAAYKEDAYETSEGPLGLLGLYASVWEITQSIWGKNNRAYVIKGGAFDLVNKPWLMHPYLKAAYNENDVVNQNVGFRCVKP